MRTSAKVTLGIALVFLATGIAWFYGLGTLLSTSTQGSQWRQFLEGLEKNQSYGFGLMIVAILAVVAHFVYWKKQTPQPSAPEQHVYQHYSHEGRLVRVGEKHVPMRPIDPNMIPPRQPPNIFDQIRERTEKMHAFYAKASGWVQMNPDFDFHDVDAHLDAQPEYRELEKFMPKLDPGTVYGWSPIGGSKIHPRILDLKKAIEEWEKSLRI